MRRILLLAEANRPPGKGFRLQASDFRLQEKKQWPAVAKLPPFLLRLKSEA